MYAFHLSCLAVTEDDANVIAKIAVEGETPNLPSNHVWLYHSPAQYATGGAAKRAAKALMATLPCHAFPGEWNQLVQRYAQL
jgi:hypothetical protein